MQRKNRQLKVTVNVPDRYESDEDFLEALQECLDEDAVTISEWDLIFVLVNDDNEEEELVIPINKIHFNGFEIEPEE